MNSLKSIDPNKLVTMATLTALAISEDVDIDDMNILAGFFSTVSSVLAMKATQLVIQEEQQQQAKKQIEDLQDQLKIFKK